MPPSNRQRRPNGHGPDSVTASQGPLNGPLDGRERGGALLAASGGSQSGHAASDDASKHPAASVPAFHAGAGTDCEAYAVAAPPPTQSHPDACSAGRSPAAFSSSGASSTQD